MKCKLVTLLLIFIGQQLYGQTKIATINGVVKNILFSYAYLYDADSNVAKFCPIADGKFQFNMGIEKELKLFNLFLASDSLTKNQIESRIKDRSSIRMVALADMQVTVVDRIETAEISGGELNKALDEMNISIVNLNYENYFDKYPDSVVSIYFLKLLAKVSKMPMLSSPINLRSYYTKLSDRIKNSDEGKMLYTTIFN